MTLWNKLFGRGDSPASTPAPTQMPARPDVPASRAADALAAPTLLNMDALMASVDMLAAQYRTAEPFPHLMLENLIDTAQVRTVVEQFPAPEAELDWRRVDLVSSAGDLVQDKKLGYGDVNLLGPAIRELLWELNSGSFLRFLEKLTGIEGLIADPGLQGGGIHQVLPGGMLAVHADFTRHKRYDLDRRLNVLVYLNEDWPEDWGGELELWSPDMQRCVRRIRPLAGRCVIFNTAEDSFHGHPRPLACPPGHTRKSIALYYYTCGRDDAEVAATDLTRWQRVPDVDLPVAE